MGGLKRDPDKYVQLVTPKQKPSEPAKRVLPEDITLEEAMFGTKPETWKPPKDSTGVKMIQKYQVFEITEIAGEVKRVAGPVFSNQAQAEQTARNAMLNPSVTSAEVIDMQTGKRVFVARAQG